MQNGTLQDQSGRDMPDEPSICEVIEKKSRHGAVGNVEITSRKEHDDKLEMCNYKSGYLLKLSKRRFKDNTWRRRKCVVDGGHMQIFFEKEHKSPRCINLSASSNVRILSDTSDDRCFALASKRKTYHLQVTFLLKSFHLNFVQYYYFTRNTLALKATFANFYFFISGRNFDGERRMDVCPAEL